MTPAKAISVLLILPLLAAAPATQPAPGATLPHGAEIAKQQYTQSVDKARAEMDAAIERARKQFEEKESHLKASYIEKLDQAIAGETKKGNLDGAIAVRNEKAAVEGGAPTGNGAPGTATAVSVKSGLLMAWEGKDAGGQPFPFIRVIERIPPSLNKASRALPLKVPDGTPTLFQGFIRIQRDGEGMLLKLKADAYTLIGVDIDGQTLLKLDNRSDSREFQLDRGLHRISIRFSGEATTSYQLFSKRTGLPVADYVFDTNDLTGKQIVK
jgi:hypothetical protein